MDINEFNRTVLRTEDTSTVTFDVRPCGNRQGEAIASYLHEVLMALRMNVGTFGPRPTVLLCD
jgi:hypothetical protein